jgi:hypothetical protein
MRNDEAIASLDVMISHHMGVLAALQKARDVLAGDATPAPPALKALPAPAHFKRRKAAQPGTPAKPKRLSTARATDTADYSAEVDGISFACTEMQAAVIGLFAQDVEYVTGGMVLPLYDNKKWKWWASLEYLRARMKAAGIVASINTYHRKGYRLEGPEY